MKTYFIGLSGLRFIGAFSVVLGHIELIKSFYGIPNLMEIPFYKNTSGHTGVILFFVLSGFLITYFLLEELKEDSKINLKHFYIKRILRIWPIYYIMVIFSILLFPLILTKLGEKTDNYTFEQIKYYLIFSPNISKSLKHSIPGAVHLWSIGVEEQFYLIWPILIYIFKKYLPLLFITTFIIFSLIPSLIDYTYIRSFYFQQNIDLKNFLSSFFISFKINAMAIGALFAFWYHTKNKILLFFYSKYIELLIMTIPFILWVLGIQLGRFTDEIYSIMFAILILVISTKKNTAITLENSFFTFFGNISYGMYVYHWVIIVIIITILKQTNININENQTIVNVIIYFFGISLTILSSYLSYLFIEKPILGLKNKIFKQY